MNLKNKNQEENWEKKLTQFLLSEEILFENEIGEGLIKILEGKQLKMKNENQPKYAKRNLQKKN